MACVVQAITFPVRLEPISDRPCFMTLRVRAEIVHGIHGTPHDAIDGVKDPAQGARVPNRPSRPALHEGSLKQFRI